MLYCINKPAMHQRIDTVNKRRETTYTPTSLKMKPVEEAPKPPPPPKPPITPASVPEDSKKGA